MDPIFEKKQRIIKRILYFGEWNFTIIKRFWFCNQLKCKYCLKFSVDCNMCERDKCLKCYRFNKSKDILINSGDFFISNYVQDFLHDYFKVSDLTN